MTTSPQNRVGRAGTSTWNFDMSAAPKGGPILGLCRDKCGSADCGYHTGTGATLCLYHAHAEGLSRVEDGPHVIVWGGGWADSYEDGGGWMPDSWFRFGSEFEEAANPIAWMEIPSNEAVTDSRSAEIARLKKEREGCARTARRYVSNMGSLTAEEAAMGVAAAIRSRPAFEDA